MAEMDSPKKNWKQSLLVAAGLLGLLAVWLAHPKHYRYTDVLEVRGLGCRFVNQGTNSGWQATLRVVNETGGPVTFMRPNGFSIWTTTNASSAKLSGQSLDIYSFSPGGGVITLADGGEYEQVIPLSNPGNSWKVTLDYREGENALAWLRYSRWSLLRLVGNWMSRPGGFKGTASEIYKPPSLSPPTP